MLCGCVASAPEEPSGTPGGAQPTASLEASGAQVSKGTAAWTQDLPNDIGPLRTVRAFGDVYVVAGLEPGSTTVMSQVAGRMRTGTPLGSLSYGNAMGFPKTSPEGTITAGVRRKDGLQVWAWDTRTGAKRWNTQVTAQGPRPFALVNGFAQDNVLVQTSAPDAGNLRESGLLALRASDGSVNWQTPDTYQWREVVAGPVVVATHREDQARTGPIDRVAFIDPANGDVLADFAWLDYRSNFRPTGIAVSADRVLLRGDRNNAEQVVLALADRSGAIVWQHECSAEPTVDLEGQVVACVDGEGNLVARDIMSGEVLWQMPAAQVESTGVLLGSGGDTLFWGSAGPDDGMAMDSRTGQALFITPFWGIDMRRWSDDVFLVAGEDSVTGYSGRGMPIGTYPNKTVPLFMTRD